MKYEILMRDGTVRRMQLIDATDPDAEVTKWPDAADVAMIRPVDTFDERVPVVVEPTVAAIESAQASPEIKEAVIALAETIGTDRTAFDARLAEVERFMSSLKVELQK